MPRIPTRASSSVRLHTLKVCSMNGSAIWASSRRVIENSKPSDFPPDAEGHVDELDRRPLLLRELHLQPLRPLPDVLEDLPVGARIVEVLRGEPLRDPVRDRGVDVVAAEVGVARRRAHLEHVALRARAG